MNKLDGAKSIIDIGAHGNHGLFYSVKQSRYQKQSSVDMGQPVHM